MSGDISLTVFYVVTISCLTIIVVVSLIAKAIGRSKARRREFQELQQRISYIKDKTDEISEQLAHIISRLG